MCGKAHNFVFSLSQVKKRQPPSTLQNNLKKHSKWIAVEAAEASLVAEEEAAEEEAFPPAEGEAEVDLRLAAAAAAAVAALDEVAVVSTLALPLRSSRLATLSTRARARWWSN